MPKIVMRAAVLVALLISPPALAQTRPPERQETPEQGIVVIGLRIQDYRDRLARCLARNCPTNEDADATMALAEALFVEGEYRQARTAIRASLSRNRREVRNYPEPVSDLYRANARVARNLGLDRDAAISTREILRSLQAGLPVEDHRHFTARLEIAQSLVAFRQYDQAERELRTLAERAQAAGRDDVVAAAELRALWVSYVRAPFGLAVRRELNELSQSTDPRRSIGAKMLLIRIYSERGEPERSDALIAELGRSSQRRQLLYNPPYELAQQEDADGNARRAAAISERGLYGANIADSFVGNFDNRWIDVGFWIRPDGRVEGLEIARQRNDASWADPLLTSIRGRRYAPSDGARTYRLERYTYTSGYLDRATGTRTMTRSPRARVEYFDLSGDSPAPAARENGTR